MTLNTYMIGKAPNFSRENARDAQGAKNVVLRLWTN